MKAKTIIIGFLLGVGLGIGVCQADSLRYEYRQTESVMGIRQGIRRCRMTGKVWSRNEDRLRITKWKPVE